MEKRMPVSDKGKGRGIGLLNVKQSIDKYDGDLQLKQDGNRFVADLFLNFMKRAVSSFFCAQIVVGAKKS